MLAYLFAVTLFASASLLFVVQPLVGRMLLPSLGGSPSVWNTCMLFFQGTLLLGYLYTHYATRRLKLRDQILLHLAVLLVPLFFLPMSLSAASPNVDYPVLSLLLILSLRVGVPFFVVSTTAPLLQRWFSLSSHRSAKDPYFLYAASNLGSLLALLSYPLWFEPNFSLHQQAQFWKWGYLGFLGLVALCGLRTLLRGEPPIASNPIPPNGESKTEEDPISSTPHSPLPTPDSPLPKLSWLILGMIPSSLLLAVTSYITTDIAPIPLLWVIPLALYLLTFIFAFSSSISVPLKLLGRVTTISLIAQTFAMLTHATEPLWILLPLHLFTFFCGALLCHGWVAKLRPQSEELTRFYLYLSLGGVLGGVFNTLLAPLVFHRLGEVEYPLLLVLIAAMRPERPLTFRVRDGILPLLVAILVLIETLLLRDWTTLQGGLHSLSIRTGLKPDQIRSACLFGLPLILVYCLSASPVRFALGLGVLFLFGSLSPGPWGETIYLERNSLGVIRVSRDEEEKFHRMVHGNTIHGVQRLGSNDPLSFYHRTGPVGKVFSRVVDRWEGERTIGMVGLGTGSVATYAKPTQTWHFFELDPAVERIARDERYFTFLRDSRAKSWDVHLGDARLQLATFPDATFDLLILDAFSSDAIPIHLLTLEALELYLKKLKPEGVLLFHISNRTLDLGPILERLAREVEPRCYTEVMDDKSLSDAERDAGKSPSVWCVLSRNRDLLARATNNRFLRDLPLDPRIPLWRDDRVNLWPVWKWNRDED